jgi:hypothetical protein
VTVHRFARWLVENHGQADTRLGDLACDVAADPQFPRTGGRRELRGYLERIQASDGALESFELAWDAYASTRCLSAGCTATAAGDASSYCRAHGGRAHSAAT